MYTLEYDADSGVAYLVCVVTNLLASVVTVSKFAHLRSLHNARWLVFARNCSVARMLPREVKLVPE